MGWDKARCPYGFAGITEASKRGYLAPATIATAVGPLGAATQFHDDVRHSVPDDRRSLPRRIDGAASGDLRR